MSHIFQVWTGPGARARQATGFMFVFRLLGYYEVSFKYTGLFIHNILSLYGEDLLAPRPTPMLEGHRFSAVRDIFQYIRSHPLYLKAFSIRNLRTRHAVATVTQ